MNTLSATLTENTATCDLPSGEHLVRVEATGRTPLYSLARKLEALGLGDWCLQAYTPTGTPSLRGLVSAMAGLTVTERDKEGLRLEKFRPFPPRGKLAQRDLGSEGTKPPEKEETPLSESPPDEKAA